MFFRSAAACQLTETEIIASYPRLTHEAIRSLPGDPVTDLIEPSQALDVEMNKLSGVVSLVTHRWSRRLPVTEPAQSLASANTSDRRWADLSQAGDLANGSTLLSQRDDSLPNRKGRSTSPSVVSNSGRSTARSASLAGSTPDRGDH